MTSVPRRVPFEDMSVTAVLSDQLEFTRVPFQDKFFMPIMAVLSDQRVLERVPFQGSSVMAVFSDQHDIRRVPFQGATLPDQSVV